MQRRSSKKGKHGLHNQATGQQEENPGSKMSILTLGCKNKSLGCERKKKKKRNAWAWVEKKERKDNGFGPVDFDWPKLKPKPIF